MEHNFIIPLKNCFYAFNGLTFFASAYTNNAARVPSTIPANTSVGKCTKKYNLLKAIKAARRSAATPAFLLCKKIVTAAAKLCRVCPDGKDYSPGGGINSTISLSKA